MPKISKNRENLMKSSYAIYFKKEITAENYILLRKQMQSMIVKRCMNNIFRLKKSISVKNGGAHFTLKISTNQDLEPMMCCMLLMA